MTVFDIVVIFILGSFFLFSLFKGMVREVFSFLGYLAGYVLAINYHNELAIILQGMVTKEIMARIVGFTIIFIVVKITVALIIFFTVKIIFGLLGRLVRGFMDGSAVLSFPDRVLGGVLGLLKGLVIIAILMFPLTFFEDNYKKVTQGSVLAPYLEKIIHIVSQESNKNKLFEKIKSFPVDDVKNSIKEMGDLEKFTKEVTTKKDELSKFVQDLVLTEKTQENHTDDDRKKLNDLLNNLSEK